MAFLTINKLIKRLGTIVDQHDLAGITLLPS